MTTGWPPGLLQDDSRKLSDWFASRVDARWIVRQVCAEIEEKRKMNLTKPTQPFTEPRGNKSESRIKVEKILAEYTPKGGIGIPRIAELAEIDESTVRKAIAPLRDAQQLVNVGRPRIPVYLWVKEQPLKKAEPIRYVPRGSYDGAELRPYEGRPGAMDAYSKPSLRDGVLVPYNGIRPMLVGSLKDSSNNAR